MSTTANGIHWKSFYASDQFKWEQVTVQDKNVYYRQLGIVENLFDLDGIDYEGRADLNMHTTIEFKTSLNQDELKKRILLAWTCLRGLYPLLACKSLYKSDLLPQVTGRRWIDKCFVYEKPSERRQMIKSSQQHVTFLQDSYSEVDVEDFFTHILNASRVFNEKETLSRLFVSPPRKTDAATFTMSLVMVAGHEVADGLTVFRLSNSFIDLINKSEADLLKQTDVLCSERIDTMKLLPPPQEALYPVYARTIARDRWNWTITRVLRHVRKPLLASFGNPLRRDAPLTTAVPMAEKYSKVLDYSRVPPLNSIWIGATLPARANRNLVKLCRQAGISIGSGAFALVGMVMMRLEELRQPNVPYWERLPFVGSFPVNPRPFLSGTPTTGKEASLMLAFSDGVTLPFIPSDLDLAKTFRVLGRLAHRQLRQYQKRKRTSAEEAFLGSRSPRELLPALYLSTMERCDMRAKPDQRVGFNPQGAYPAKSNPTLATCGISSVGDVSSLLGSGKYDLETGQGDLVADFRELRSIVRPREGEFLVGTIGLNGHMHFRASCDSSAIDPKKAQAWAEMLKSILDFETDDNIVSTPNAKDRLSRL